MLKRVHLLLTIYGNVVLISSLIAVAVSVQQLKLNHSVDIRISRDIFIPFVASSVVLCFISIVSVVILASSRKIMTHAESKSKPAKMSLAGLKLALTAFTFVAVAIPAMTPKFKTRCNLINSRYLAINVIRSSFTSYGGVVLKSNPDNEFTIMNFSQLKKNK